VEAAKPICESYFWVSAADCTPVTAYGDGTVSIASGAARYNPVLYWVFGTVARPFNGTAALYAMRIFSCLLNAVLVASATWCLRLWAKSGWPLLALVVCLTPMTMYTGSTPAPNGPEMFAGLLVWCALLGLRYSAPRSRETTALVAMATLGACVLSSVRSLGPFWLGLITISVATVLGIHCVRSLLAQRSRLVGASLGGVLVVTAASAWWTLSSGANSLTGQVDRDLPSPWGSSLRLIPVWLLQSIGAFPNKVDAAPGIVYGTAFLLLASALSGALWYANARERLLLCGLTLLTVAVPVVISARTFSQLGPVGKVATPFLSRSEC
jgi:hypothetical protein